MELSTPTLEMSAITFGKVDEQLIRKLIELRNSPIIERGVTVPE